MFEKLFWSREAIETLIYDALKESYNRKGCRIFMRLILVVIGILAIPYWCVAGIVMGFLAITNPIKIKPEDFKNEKGST